MSRRLPELAPFEAQQLEFCDRLDAWLWAMRHEPRLRRKGEWLACEAELRREAQLLHVAIDISELMGEVLE